MTKTQEQITKLQTSVALNEQALETIRADVDKSAEDFQSLNSDVKQIVEQTHKMVSEQQVLNQRLNDLQKSIDQWHISARTIVRWFLGILSALIIGLLFLLLRKSP